MNDQMLKLTNANAMGLAGQQAGTSADTMRSRLNQLIADMESDHQAVSGGTLPAFRTARAELNEAFSGLMNWCAKNGVDLEEGQRDAVTVDDDGRATYQGAQTGLQINHV